MQNQNSPLKYKLKEILTDEISQKQKKILMDKWIFSDNPSLQISVSSFYNYLKIQQGEKWEIPISILVQICKDLSEITGEQHTIENIHTELITN